MGMIEEMFSSGVISYGFLGLLLDALLVLVFLIGVSWYAYRWYTKKSVYKYPFVFIDRFGTMRITNAKLVTTSKGIKKFCIKDFENPEYWLPIEHEPSLVINATSYRVACADGMGGLHYSDTIDIKESDLTDKQKEDLKAINKTNTKLLENEDIKLFVAIQKKLKDISFVKNVKVEKKQYLETTLDSIEKSEQADSIEEARSFNPLDPISKYMVFFLIGLVVLIGFLGWMNAKALVAMSDNSYKSSVAMEKVAKDLATTAKTVETNNQLQLAYLSVLGQNFTIEMELK